ncbi:Transposon Ty3-G Gag-Pol polyprotein [Gossypium australe]|uniref:Transposon Ty3-G Gag-Pol polyprotein n=1 Tax=Gossypium australe TaxID=47621 RepID=A0A5B6WTS2_9ROSI|nr:Transposon Ty3-G Gag-Pol polyprotein [Gossypium australe]
MLIQPEPGKDFLVYSDASHTGLGCMLMQERKVVAYASKKLKWCLHSRFGDTNCMWRSVPSTRMTRVLSTYT